MIIETYFIIMLIGIIATAYTVLYQDDENMTHIISGVLSAVVWFIVGYQTYIGIDVQHVMESSVYSEGSIVSTGSVVELTTYHYPWLGMVFIVAGVIMTLYSIVQGFNINIDMIKGLEGKDIHNPNEKDKDIHYR